ncbi:hypothetical protein Mgra_00002340 [Meloidogyne graminicola]|uniref:Uncharacterized protein n=1 Tax=Meloidogyne graminicola TaxID=189291 RepID=A0A8S9ZWJ7_9BILA|nr:hypothetical protein Mgra_00002340 [Meloidogyne graminicola]
MSSTSVFENPTVVPLDPVGKLQNEVKSLNGTVDGLVTQMTEMQNKMAGLEKGFNNYKEKMQNKMGGLEKGFNDYKEKTKTKIEALEKELKEVKRRSKEDKKEERPKEVSKKKNK